MPITVNGSGTITGVSVGGLPDGIVDTDMLAAGAVTAAKRGAGGILQVVSVANNTAYYGTNTSFSDTFSASITPSATTSKILILAQLAIGHQDAHTGLGRMVRQIGSGSFTAFGGGAGTGSYQEDNVWWTIRNSVYCASPYTVPYLDSPSTTSAVTYKAQMKTSHSSYPWAVNQTQYNSDDVYTSPAGSSITLVEVAA